jgi:hypothetical protein
MIAWEQIPGADRSSGKARLRGGAEVVDRWSTAATPSVAWPSGPAQAVSRRSCFGMRLEESRRPPAAVGGSSRVCGRAAPAARRTPEGRSYVARRGQPQTRLAAPPRGTNDVAATATTSSPCSPDPSARSRRPSDVASAPTRTKFRRRRWCCARSTPRQGDRQPDATGRAAQASRRHRDTLAKAAVRDAALLALDENAEVSHEAGALTRDMMRAAGIEPEVEVGPTGPPLPRPRTGRAAVGRLAAAGQSLPRPGLLGCPAENTPSDATGRLGTAGPSSARSNAQALALRRAWRCPFLVAHTRAGRELMPPSPAGRRGRGRTPHFLLADEPGLGKTAQALLARRRPTPTPCSSSCRTSSRRLGARGRAVDPTAPPP